MRAVFQRVTSKIQEHRDQGVLLKLELCRMLAFFFIVLFVEPDLRKDCRKMFSHLVTIFRRRPKAKTGYDYTLQNRVEVCLAMMYNEDRVYNTSRCPQSEEDSIFPDALLDALLKLGGEGCRRALPRQLSKLNSATHLGNTKLTFVTETRPATQSEPGPSSAAVTSLASASNQEIEISDSPGTSGEEPQPTYAMQDIEETKAAHGEDGGGAWL